MADLQSDPVVSFSFNTFNMWDFYFLELFPDLRYFWNHMRFLLLVFSHLFIYQYKESRYTYFIRALHRPKNNKSNMECKLFTMPSIWLLPHDYIFLPRKIRFNDSSLFKRQLWNYVQLEWLFILIFISTSARWFVVRFLFSFYKDCIWLKIDSQ